MTATLVPVSWVERASCRTMPTAWFYPQRGDMLAIAVAKAICARCPVRRACLDEALAVEGEYVFGIRGGLSPDERRAARASYARSRATSSAKSASSNARAVRIV